MSAEDAPGTGGGTTGALDAPRVARWVEDHTPATGPLRFELIPGGRSNLTYRVTAADGARFVLRRPPIHHVLPTAHDMAREFTMLASLGPSPVPVPEAIALCEDPAVNGLPFYVMEHVDGHILADRASAEAHLDLAARRRAGTSLATTLAALHDVDVDAVGLGGLAKRDGYVERQLRRWDQQFHQSQVPGLDTRVVTTVHDRLSAQIPAQRTTTIVHGDFRLDNTVLDDTGDVRAVLDWEISTLGDPMADLGLLMVFWTEPGDPPALVDITPTTAPGFATRADICNSYADASGRDVSDLAYFVAFGYWKLACILQGVYARYVAGARAGDPSSVEGYRSSIVTLAELAIATLAREDPLHP